MRLCYLTVVLLCACSVFLHARDKGASPTGLSDEEAKEGFVAIFDGKSLDGWVGLNDDTGSYYVKDGMLVCKATGKVHIFTKQEYGGLEHAIVTCRQIVHGLSEGKDCTNPRLVDGVRFIATCTLKLSERLASP